MTTETITVRSEGRRHYIAGLPFDLKDTAKEAGCRWDPDLKMWWSGKSEVAIEVVQRAQSRQVQVVQQREERSANAQADAAARGVLAGHPAKLPSGDWGVKVLSQARPVAGAKVTVTTLQGKSWETSVESVIDGQPGGWLVTTPPRPQRGNGRWSAGRRWNPDNAPGGRRCPECGQRDCSKAWDGRGLCDED
jgi:hypothetical protein